MEDRRNLEVYRASAGSGKTFTLAVKYITLLIASPDAYRHIAAVTFTKKATAEMKERILSQLYGIAYSLPSSEDYMRKMQEAYPDKSREQISENARKALNLILHDYGHFRIQTIDAFFQSVLRSLAKELELNGDVEFFINGDELLDDAVDSYIKHLDKESAEMEQLISYIEERLDSDKSWRVVPAIKTFAKQLLQEEYLQRGDKLREQIEADNGAILKKFHAETTSLRKECENEINDKINNIYHRFSNATTGLSENDFLGKSKGIWSIFQKLKDFSIKESKELPKSATIDKILNGTTPKEKLSKFPQINDLILSLLQELKDIDARECKIYNSCNMSLEMFHRLGLLNVIARTLKSENERENRFLLAETTYFLSKMITNSTSFIFEKIGTEINHIFIDEFQDTSKLQWECFKILLDEVIARGNYNLIVGDVKQSIYRWRNSDWSIMNNIESFHPETIKIASQEVKSGGHTYQSTNYRSSRRIVAFNNRLFRSAINLISTTFDEELGNKLDSLKRAYSDVEQAVPSNKKDEGFVQITLLKKEKEAGGNAKEKATDTLMSTLHNFIDVQKIPAGRIAILVRGNAVIPIVVEAFKREFPALRIVSEEAYRLSASPAVQLIIAAMRYINTPSDDINFVNLVTLYNKIVQKQSCNPSMLIEKEERVKFLPDDFLQELPFMSGLPIYELIEKIICTLHIERVNGEEAYIFSFLDYASQCINNKTADLKGFLDEWERDLCDKTIPAESSDSIRIMTIHASKGLEFDTVIIPYCNWELTGRTGNTLWCEPAMQPFDTLSLIPMNSKKAMLNSIYAEDYNHDKLFQIVDNLNLLYVATTRAKRNLIIFIEAGEKGTTYSMSRLVEGLLPDLTSLEGSSLDAENTSYTYGEICVTEKKKKEEKKDNPFIIESEQIKKQKFASYDNHLTFKQSRELARFLASDSKERRNYDSVARGELMHSILAKLNTGKELSRQLRKMLIEGLISTERELNFIKNRLEKALSLPEVKEWFSGKYKLFNECAILCSSYKKEKNTYRPDRVMIYNDEVVVVDYKFAKKSPAHKEQVKDYMNLLAIIGYTKINGYVWYVDRDEIEKV